MTTVSTAVRSCSCSVCLSDSGGNEPKEYGVPGEAPAKVRTAVSTEGDLPVITRKPAEDVTCPALEDCSRCGAKASDFKSNPGWIKKGVFVAALNGQGQLLFRDDSVTECTAQRVLVPVCHRRIIIFGRRRTAVSGPRKVDPADPLFRHHGRFCSDSGR